MRILIVSDAWEPQVNGVVRTLKMTRRELELKGHQTELISPLGFRSLPCPTYPEISLALCTTGQLERQIDRFVPDCLHIATEGPLGWQARRMAIKRKWPFTTACHSLFPEHVEARFGVPVGWIYGLLRRFHNAASRRASGLKHSVGWPPPIKCWWPCRLFRANSIFCLIVRQAAL